MTFSQHVARKRSSAIYYSVLFAVALPLLYLFFADWFVPEFKLSGWFTALVLASVAAQFLCTLIPEIGGWKTTVHRVLAGISGIALLPLVAMMIVSSHISPYGRILAGITLVAMTVLLAIGLKNQQGHRYSLLLQAGYYVFFFALVFMVAYF